jgi:serine/threonine protein kinase
VAADAQSLRTLSDRWELTERLGSGAMGEVWRGRHLVLGHEVAVKLMKRDASRDQQLVARFVREARIAAQLRHRNIARVEDFGTTPEAAGNRPFLVMELLRGDSLESLLEAHGRVDLATVSVVARHVGAACDVAHAAGIVHRDLKPANCFLVRDDDGTPLVKVLDFGVAKVADGLVTTQHGLDPGAGFALIGTPVYMSPEQAQGDAQLDGRSDLWSLGVMLYELVTGKLPYTAETLPGLLCQIVAAEVTPPSGHDPSLPSAFDAWARRAFARERAERFQTGKALAEAFIEALGAPRHTLPPSPRTREQPVAIPRTVPEFEAATLHSLAPVAVPSRPPSPLLGTDAGTVAMAAHSLPGPMYVGAPPYAPMSYVPGSLTPQEVVGPGAQAVAGYPSMAPTVPVRRSSGWMMAALLVLGGVGLGAGLVALGQSPAAPSPVRPTAAPAPVETPPAPVAAPVPAAVAVPAPVAAPAPAPVAAPAPVLARPAPVRRAVAVAAPRVAPAEPLPAPRFAPPPPAPHAGAYNPDEP